MEYLFNFNGTFEIHDDIEVLKRMGLALGLDKNECTDEDVLKAKSVLPKALEKYIDQIGKRSEDWRSEFPDLEFDESFFNDGDMGENSEHIYEVTGNSALGLSGLESSSADLTNMSMSVEDLEMQAAIDSLEGGSAGQQLGSPNDQDDGNDSYEDDEDDDV